MISKLSLLLLCGVISTHLGYAQKLPKVKKLNMKVHINITGETLVMKFHRPNEALKLEGFILGYGSNYFSNQYIQWPDNGKPYITDVDAETRYLIAVKPNENSKKMCKDKNSVQKPLQLVIGTMTPTSVYLSWGILINPQVDWSALSKCPNDRFYTVRYREKNKDWNFQLCPSTETVVDNLKPNTMYEFGVKDNSDDAMWSKCLNYKTIPKGKENGHIENNYKIPKGTLQYASEDTKALIPVMIVKQGFQNISKSAPAPPPTELSPVFREETKKPPLTTTRPSTPKPRAVSKVTDSPPVSKSPEKPVLEDPKPAVTAKPFVESFTPDSSTGTLEWVGATMAPTETKVSKSEVLSSTEEPQTKLAFPPIAPVPLTKELPVVHPETVLASDQLATYKPEAKESHYTIPAGEKPTEAPVISSELTPEQHRTIPGEVPLSFDEQQVSTDTPIKLHTSSGRQPASTAVSKLSTLLPFPRHTTFLATTSKNIPAKQSTQLSQPHTKPTTGGEVPLSFDEQRVSTETPIKLHTTSERHPVSTIGSKQSTHFPFQRHTTFLATTSKSIPAKQSTQLSQTHTKTTTAFFGSDNIITTQQSIARTAVPHPVPAGEEPVSTEAPVVSSEFIAEPHRTLPAGEVPLPFDEQQVSTETPIELHTASGSHSTSTVASKLSTHVPFQRRTTFLATTSKNIPAKQSTQLFQPLTKTTTAFIGRDNVITTPQRIARTSVPHPVPVPTEMSLFHPKPIPGTEEPDSEADSTQPDSETISTDTPHTFEPETSTLVSDEQTDLTVVQMLTSKPKPHTTIAYRITSMPFTTNTPTTSQKKKSTQAPKSKQTSTVQPKITLPKQAQPTDVFKTTKPAKFIEDTTITVAETQTIPSKKAFSTVGPVPQFVPGKMEKAVPSKSEKTSQRPPTTAVPKPAQTKKMPINLIRIHIFDDPDLPTVTNKTEKAVSSVLEKTSQSPPTTSVPKAVQTKKMPINLIRLHIFDNPELPSVTERTERAVSSILEKTSQSPPTTAVPKPAQTTKMPINLIRLLGDPTLPTVESETQTTSTSIQKITQSNKMSEPKLAPKTTQKAPIHLIRLHIFEDPDISLVPNTTLTPSQSSTTLKLQTPHSTPVPTQKVSQQKTQKPKPTPRTRTKPASTARTKDTTTKPKVAHVTAPTTLAPYKTQHSTSRPRTSLRPRTRPAQNGTAQGTIRPRPTGDFNWAPGTIPGGRVLDNTKLLGVSRNISMEPNNTGKKIVSVSATPLPPIRPTSMRRRIPASNVTGRPISFTVSSPPLSPVKPTSIRRKPPINGTSRPATAGGILIPRAPSTARPNCTMGSKKPTIPAPDEDFVDATVFSPSPKSDIDALGQPRYTAPHVKYVSKEDNIPCSITETLKHFPTEEGTNQEAVIPPQNPPSNLSVVTVEGCPSFVILDWEQPDNDTVTEYKVISTENGSPTGKDQSITTTNQTYSTVENLKPNTSYEFRVVPKNPLGEGPVSTTVEFNTESADPRVSEPVTGGKDAIWTSIKFKSDSYSECKGKQFVKRTWYKKFVGIQLCNSLRYKIYLSDTLTGTFYNIGDQSGYGEDHCQFVDSFLDGRTGQQLLPDQLTTRKGFYRSVRQQPVEFGEIGGRTHISYVHWYECGIAIPGKW